MADKDALDQLAAEEHLNLADHLVVVGQVIEDLQVVVGHPVAADHLAVGLETEDHQVEARPRFVKVIKLIRLSSKPLKPALVFYQ